jgi:type IV pilus assembly protein PilY1
MDRKHTSLLSIAIFMALWCSNATATVTVTDNFTGASASQDWVPYKDACLTAGGGTGTIPACSSGGLPAPSPGSTTPGSGALQLTPNETDQTGAIIDPTPFPSNEGLTVTFNTYTFGGNDFGGTGADGIGFYLINGNSDTATTNPGESATNTNGGYTLTSGFALGALGGSGGYQCSNTNDPANGMPGGYLGLGIDEYGNFVNPDDNTKTGPNGNNIKAFYPNSLGMRGYGDVNQNSIAAALTAAGIILQSGSITNTDVQTVCANGGNVAALVSKKEKNTSSSPATLPDYAYIPGSFVQLPTTTTTTTKAEPIYSQENATTPTISNATPISYKVTLTPSGALTLQYSYNNGAYVTAINNQSISATNGPIPSQFLFGFGASTGGGSNYHDITCFQAGPANQSSSSASVNVQQTGELQTSTQVFLAFYSPDNWWGRLTAQQLTVDPSTGAVAVSPDVNWDAACVLTGGVCASTYAGGYSQPIASTPQQSYSTLPALSWSGLAGTLFSWSDIPATEQGWLNAAAGPSGTSFGQNLLHYLKGDTKYNATSYTGGTSAPQFRTRTEILGDIINSSPTWVGAPDEGLPNTFSNALYPSSNASYAENVSGAQTYSAFVTAESGRNNVVYVGANDGMLHGFQAGSYSNGTFNTITNNGLEVLGYVPYAVLEEFGTQSPTNSSNYASPDYGHNFYVDATPATGDVFYGGNWHTLLVSGLGTGGRGLFALDINKPATATAATTSGGTTTISAGTIGSVPTASDVLADLTFANHGDVPTSGAVTPSAPALSVINGPTGASYEQLMGDIQGTPIIRLMNNGDFAIITGNGQNSDDGEAGIFIFLINPSATGFSISKTIFLGTGTPGSTTSDGIDYVSSADLNGDHFADYLYAGDTQGNVWRFNVTSSSSSNWHVSTYGQSQATPLFSAGNTQPITTRVLVDTNIGPTGVPQVMLQFGTGETTPLTNTSGATYSTTPQAIYDVWDWDMDGWNGLTGATKYASLSSLIAASGSSSTSITPSDLQTQTITAPGTASNGDNAVTVSSNTVCWAGSASCSGTPQYGSVINLPSVTSNGETLYQQVTYNPSFVEGAAVFDTTIPPYNNAYTCTSGLQSGYTYAFNTLTGGAISGGFFRSSGNSGTAITLGGIPVSGLQLNATGSPSVVSANGHPVMVQQTVSGTPVATEVFPAGGMGSQVNWIQLR